MRNYIIFLFSYLFFHNVIFNTLVAAPIMYSLWYILYIWVAVDTVSHLDQILTSLDKITEHNPFIIDYVSNMHSIPTSEDDDTNKDDVLDTMDKEERQHLANEKIVGKYYIGTCALIENNPHYLIMMTVSTNTFYKYAGVYLDEYLHEYVGGLDLKILKHYQNQIDIPLNNGLTSTWTEYCACDKTHWLRLVQRNWKRVLSERKNGANTTLRGMLAAMK